MEGRCHPSHHRGLSPRPYPLIILQGQILQGRIPGCSAAARDSSSRTQLGALQRWQGPGRGSGPLDFAGSGCPQRGRHLCPTLPKGRRGLAAGRARWERRRGGSAGGRARARPAAQRYGAQPPAAKSLPAPRGTPRGETDPRLQSCCPQPGEGAENGWGCKVWSGSEVRHPSSLPVALLCLSRWRERVLWMQPCRLTARVMGSSIIPSPLLREPSQGQRLWYCLASPPPASRWKDLVHWEKLGSSRKSVAKQAGEGNESCFSWELSQAVPENSLFFARI